MNHLKIFKELLIDLADNTENARAHLGSDRRVDFSTAFYPFIYFTMVLLKHH